VSHTFSRPSLSVRTNWPIASTHSAQIDSSSGADHASPTSRNSLICRGSAKAEERPTSERERTWSGKRIDILRAAAGTREEVSLTSY